VVRDETVIELLTRLLIDWPKLLDQTVTTAPVARVRQAPPSQQLDACRGVAREHVFGGDADDWLANHAPRAVERWAEDAGTLPARLFGQLQRIAPDLGCESVRAMPPASVEGVGAILPPIEDEDFSRAPSWQGDAVETGALARHAHHPLVADFSSRHGRSVATRMLAQLVDLATWLSSDDGAVRQASDEPGVGLGLAETARGLLLHQARVRDGRVEAYRIVAPTEWNFHPNGALRRGLIGRPAANAMDARRDAALLVQALDPCVAYTVEAVHA
jgi:hypothetical protein